MTVLLALGCGPWTLGYDNHGDPDLPVDHPEAYSGWAVMISGGALDWTDEPIVYPPRPEFFAFVGIPLQFPDWGTNPFGYSWDLANCGDGGAPIAHGVRIYLWIPLAVGLFWTAWLWVPTRRRHGHCMQCGYNLTGNITGRCPECGTVSMTGQST